MKDSSPQKDPTDLRRRAEERWKERAAARPPHSRPDAQRLLHELEVHQIELEIQNEELLAARREVESGLERYTEIFDFAPIAYFVLSADGIIRELNLAGARLPAATGRTSSTGLWLRSSRSNSGRRLPFVSDASSPAATGTNPRGSI